MRLCYANYIYKSSFSESKSTMKFLFFALILVLSLCSTVAAVEFYTVEIAGKRVTVAKVNVRKERIALFNRDKNGQAFRHFDNLADWLQSRNQKLVFAMNGGMYFKNLSPVGLFVVDRKQLVRLNTAKSSSGNFYLKPNGVFAITNRGATVVETSEYRKISKRVILATQSGPMLVHNGKIHPAFVSNSASLNIRNGVGVASRDIAIFAISESPVNFYEFAVLFRDVLHCPNALYLDGAISGLYSTALKRNDFSLFGTIIAVVE